jgi:hypothetical protein
MILNGELNHLGVGPALQMLARATTTGVMTLARGNNIARIRFEDGRIVSATTVGGGRLGEAILGRRLISPADLSQALQRQRVAQPRPPLGALLIEMGVSARAVAEEVRAQILRVLRDVLRWTEGTYSVRRVREGPRTPGTETWEVSDLLFQVA